MRATPLPLLLAAFLLPFGIAEAVEPVTAELSFNSTFARPDALATAKAPAWITKVEQQGGSFIDAPRCWQVATGGAEGTGRLEISLDRQKLHEDLVATMLFDADQNADVAVQLFDGQGRAVVVDLFGNVEDVGKDATTDTFVIPLKKYPTAEKVVIRRISGGLKVYGVVMYPVVTEGTPVTEALTELARTLGDPLSPENPLVKGLREVAKSGNISLASPRPSVAVTPAKTLAPASSPAPRLKYAEAPTKAIAGSTPAPAAPTAGLVAHWSFENGTAADATGHLTGSKLQAGAQFAAGLRGRALQLRRNPSQSRANAWDSVVVPSTPSLDLKDSLTVSAWIKYTSIAPTWGSAIVFHGDAQFGRDPWQLHLLTDGTLEFRTDRSVTGSPRFTVFEDEICLNKGRPQMNQHVSVESPGALQPGKWYFVAGSLEKTTPRLTTLRLFVNGEQVGQVKTDETINYDTATMWTTLGAVDTGNWQNFHGQIGDVRIYDRPLALAEVQALYNQTWK